MSTEDPRLLSASPPHRRSLWRKVPWLNLIHRVRGTEIAPGVRRVDLGKRDSMIPAYKIVSMRDVVYQPKSKSMNMGMANDMVCHCLEGELRVNQGPGKDFTVKKGDVWSCNKGLPENDENVGSSVAIMRVIDLLPT